MRWVGTRHRTRSSRAPTGRWPSWAWTSLLVGQPEVLGPLAGDLEILPASEVIAMDADPGASVRRMKDSSLVRAAEAVRDGKASAMVSAGNTGATMASALLRMGRIKGVSRPAIATPDPRARPHRPRSCSMPAPTPSARRTCSCSSPRWAPCSPGSATASPSPASGLLSIGEEPTKGTPLVKETHKALAASDALRAAGGRVHRQRRGPGRHVARGGRGGDGRLHGKRRPQDARGRHAHPGGGHLRGLRVQPGGRGGRRGAPAGPDAPATAPWTPTTRAGPCSSGWTACA